MRILLTGATGFIGSHLVKELLKYPHEVYGIVRHSPRRVKLDKDLITITADLLDIHSLKKAVRIAEPEIVIHTAAFTPVRHSFTNPFLCAKTNTIGTMNMVHASLESPTLEKFIYASSAETYLPGDKISIEKPLQEIDRLYGSTPYGVSKVAADHYVRVAGDSYGLPYIVLRPSNTFGRKRERGYLTEKIITTMLTENKLVLDGTPDNVRDWLYVDDHVNGYMKAIETKIINEVFNISTGVGTSVGDLVNKVKSILGWEGEIVYGGKPRPFDPPYLVLDNSKAKTVLGWEPEYTLDMGLKKTIEYWRNNI